MHTIRMRSWRGHIGLVFLGSLFAFLPEILGQRLPVRIYTTADGLRSSAISFLMSDSHGFIWLCTRDGLSRFDGYRFVNYKIGNGSVSQYVSTLAETRQGIYWIALNDGGLYRYDPRLTTVDAGPTQRDPTSDDGRVILNAQLVSQDTFSTLHEDRQGRLWAGSNGLWLVEDAAGQITFRRVELNLPESSKQSFGISTIVEAQDGSLWLGTNHGLIRLLPDGRTVSFIVHPEGGFDTVVSLLEDRDGRIWIGHSSGLYVLKPDAQPKPSSSIITDSLKFVSRRRGAAPLPDVAGETVDCSALVGLGALAQRRSSLPANAILDIHQAADGKIWIVTNVGLAFFDGQRFQSYNGAQSAVARSLGPLAEDREGDLWIATIAGLMKLSLAGLTSYDKADGLSDAQVQSIYEDHDGALHVVNGDWFVSRLDNQTFTSVRPNIPPDAKFGWSSTAAFLDHVGDWWFLTNDGLYRFAHIGRIEQLARLRPTVYTERDGLKTRSSYCMFEDSHGDLWISTRATNPALNSLTKWQRSTEAFHTFTEADGLPSESAASFAEDRGGNLWFGFYQGGLVRYTGGRFTSFADEEGSPRGTVTALYLDHAGRLWATSNAGGLSRIDDPTAAHPHFTSYMTKEGLSSDNARCITEDLAGRIYVGTVRGVDRLTPESGRVRHFGVLDGLASDFVRTAYRDRQGVLWFGTFNGLSRLTPQSDPPPIAPSIMISGLNIAGVRHALSELGQTDINGLTLNPSQNNVQIDFLSLSLGHAPLVRYQYKLEGAAGDWSTPTEQRTVTYANLAAGSYRFLVRAISPEGEPSGQSATISFVVLRPVWQRWWFVTFSALLLVALAYLLYRYRINRLLELERVRTRIATDLHDDIGASLSRVAILSEVERQQNNGRNGESEGRLAEIANSARELVDSMSDIVWSVDPRRDDLGNVVTRVRQFGADVFEAQGIVWDLQVATDLEKTRLSPDQRRDIFLICKEALNNVARHADCRRATLSLRVSGREILAEITDDGRGFAEAALVMENYRGGHGLANMKARAVRLGGRLAIDSDRGRGTCLKLSIPLHRRT